MTADELQGQLLGIIFATKKNLRAEMKSLVGASIKKIELSEIEGETYLHFVLSSSTGDQTINVSMPGLLSTNEKTSIINIISHLSISEETGEFLFDDKVVLTGEDKKEIWIGTESELSGLTTEEKNKYSLFITTDEN